MMLKALSHGIGSKLKTQAQLSSLKSIGGNSLSLGGQSSVLNLHNRPNLKINTNREGAPGSGEGPASGIDRLDSARPTVGNGQYSARTRQSFATGAPAAISSENLTTSFQAFQPRQNEPAPAASKRKSFSGRRKAADTLMGHQANVQPP